MLMRSRPFVVLLTIVNSSLLQKVVVVEKEDLVYSTVVGRIIDSSQVTPKSLSRHVQQQLLPPVVVAVVR